MTQAAIAPAGLRRRADDGRATRLGLRATALVWLGAMVLLPVSAVAREGLRAGPARFLAALAEPTTWSALRLTLGLAVVMALVNAVMGTWIAYVLVRARFPGRALVNALVDLPFAIPTLVTGVMLVVLFGPDSAIGAFSARHGVRLVYAPPGILLALLFVTLPFVVRAVQPVLLESDPAQEEAAMTLGASPRAAFRRVLLPTIAPAVLTGTMLGFARALGEFGSIVVVSGNIPGRTLTAAALVYGEIESGRPEVAAAVSTVLVAIAYATLLVVERLERRIRRDG